MILLACRQPEGNEDAAAPGAVPAARRPPAPAAPERSMQLPVHDLDAIPVSAYRLLRWIREVPAPTPLLRAGGTTVSAGVLQRALQVFDETFARQGFSAAPDEHTAAYVKSLLADRILQATLADEARRRGLSVQEADRQELAWRLLTQIRGQTPNLVPPKAELLDRAAEALLADALLAAVASPGEDELRAFFASIRPPLELRDGVRISDVIMPVRQWPETTEAQRADVAAAARARAERLAAALRAGAARGLAPAARPPDLAKDDLLKVGWFDVDRMPAPLARAFRNAEMGAILGPIEDADGFHVIRLWERRAGKRLELDDARELAARRWRDQYREQTSKKLFREVAQDGRVVLYAPR
ncbi:MAG: peptidyl-prolyl cis-trans isomerase [Candidatus Schekmanbacteria bacterium]|nr:peptidyl-prolyl cis-trans isomerase [Candidatus Schekmanbacteria bacterium]